MADIAPGPVAGQDCKAYYNSGTNASPTWVEIVDAQDVAVPDYGVNQVAANSRGSVNEAFVNGKIKNGVTFTYLHKRGTDTVRDALTTMVSARSAKQFAFLDGGILLVGARGIKGYFNLEKFAYTQGEEESMQWDAALKPAYFMELGAKVEPTLMIVT